MSANRLTLRWRIGIRARSEKKAMPVALKVVGALGAGVDPELSADPGKAGCWTFEFTQSMPSRGPQDDVVQCLKLGAHLSPHWSVRTELGEDGELTRFAGWVPNPISFYPKDVSSAVFETETPFFNDDGTINTHADMPPPPPPLWRSNR